MNKYQIWMEGAKLQEGLIYASYLGESTGLNFNEACDKFFNTNLKLLPLYNSNNNPRTYWGCVLFDNEIDARKFCG